jgi:hypothetical protein
MSYRLRNFLRDLFKAIAVYAAGAWLAVKIVDFAVRQYDLSRFLVDSAVIVAFGGGMIAALVAGSFYVRCKPKPVAGVRTNRIGLMDRRPGGRSLMMTSIKMKWEPACFRGCPESSART